MDEEEKQEAGGSATELEMTTSVDVDMDNMAANQGFDLNEKVRPCTSVMHL